MRNDLKDPPGCALVLALQWSKGFSEEKASSTIESLYGEIGESLPPYEFSHSKYYEKEMGPGLKKTFLEIKGTFPREALVDFKIKANSIEDQFMVDGKRQLNVDPMIVTLENIVIATGKGYSHRVYLGQGVYGDLAFTRQGKNYEPLPWTYPDYIRFQEYFEAVRRRLQKNLKIPKDM